MIVNPDVDVHTRDGADRKFVPAVRTASAASVRTASAFVVHYPVRVRAAPQSQSSTPYQQWQFASPHLKHCASHNIFLWVQGLPINLAVSILPHSVYFASLLALLELFCL